MIRLYDIESAYLNDPVEEGIYVRGRPGLVTRQAGSSLRGEKLEPVQ